MDEQLKDMWRKVRGRYCDGTYVQTRRTTDGDEFDDWLDAMLAHAWREGVRAGAKTAYDMTPMADSYEDDEQVRRDIDTAINTLDNPYENPQEEAMNVSVVLQRPNPCSPDMLLNEGVVTFDIRPLLDAMDAGELPEPGHVDATVLDDLFREASDRGIVRHWDGPFEMDGGAFASDRYATYFKTRRETR